MRRTRRRINLKNFYNWLDRAARIVETGSDNVQLGSWPGRTEQSTFYNFLDYIHSLFTTIDNTPITPVIIIHGRGESFRLEPREPDKSFLPSLDINSNSGAITLVNVEVQKLRFANCAGKITLDHVFAVELEIASCYDFLINDCNIGRLVLRVECAHNVTVNGGCILDIQSPPPASTNPFSGSVQFNESVYFPEQSGRLLAGPQAYRNLRSHMAKLENAPMTSKFHRLEQLVERENQNFFDKALSCLYRIFSDYGSSSVRPLLWFCLLFIFSVFVVILVDGGTATNSDLAGWQDVLRHNGMLARTERSFVLVVQSTLNPFGIFGPRGPVVARTGWLLAWLTVHGFLSALFVALFIFAVRRRFKVG